MLRPRLSLIDPATRSTLARVHPRPRVRPVRSLRFEAVPRVRARWGVNFVNFHPEPVQGFRASRALQERPWFD